MRHFTTSWLRAFCSGVCWTSVRIFSLCVINIFPLIAVYIPAFFDSDNFNASCGIFSVNICFLRFGMFSAIITLWTLNKICAPFSSSPSLLSPYSSSSPFKTSVSFCHLTLPAPLHVVLLLLSWFFFHLLMSHCPLGCLSILFHFFPFSSSVK